MLGEIAMRKFFAMFGALLILVTSSGCINSIQRTFDKDFADQENTREINAMFPSLPDIYVWMKQEFIQKTVSGTKALPKEQQFGYSIDQPRTFVPSNCVYIRSQLSYLGFFDKKDNYLTHFNVQDELVLTFCKERGYTVKKYKFGFGERMFKALDLKDITLSQRPVNMRYGYTYVISKNGGMPLAIYTPVIYGNYSGQRGEVTSYAWDAIFISARESVKFLDSLPNSFLDDMFITTIQEK